MTPSPRRAWLGSAAIYAALGVLVFGVLFVLLVPRPGIRIDLGMAQRIVKAQRYAPLLVVVLVPLLVGMVAPAVRAAVAGAPLSPVQQLWQAARTAPAAALHGLAGFAVVGLGLVAGIVPGVLALPIAMLVGGAVAAGQRGRAAFDATAAAIAPRRWQLTAIVVALIAIEIALTIATWKALVPPLNKKTSAAGLVATSHYAWVNAIRVAVTTPAAAIYLATRFAR